MGVCLPPKSKFTEEEIISAALTIVERDGIDGLTARELGKSLGSSARPIFTVYDSMDEVRQGVIAAAKSVYASFVEKGLTERPAFKGVGKAYIEFATKRPKLFGLLFMRTDGSAPTVDSVLDMIDESAPRILQSVIDEYALDEKSAKRLYTHLWLYTHGIATLIATGVCKFSESEISDMLTDVFIGLLVKIKSGK